MQSLAAASAGSHEEFHFAQPGSSRSEEHTSELQSRQYLVCRLLLEKKMVDQFSSIHLALGLPVHSTWRSISEWRSWASSAIGSRSFFLMMRRPPGSTPFPSRTLSR